MKEYIFVQFDHQHTQIESPDEWQEVAKSLRGLIGVSEFIVSDYGKMWHSSDVEIKERYRGPSIHFKDGEYTWWYNLIGGYVMKDK